MKKIYVLSLVFLVITLVGCNFGTAEVTTVVVDTENYDNISTVDDLRSMKMNQSYQLTNDLDLGGEEWTPIGTFDDPFLGNFNGNGYTISNFKISTNHYGYNGLFGYVRGDIENISIVGFDIDIEDDFLMNVGGLAGVSYGSVKEVVISGDIKVKSNSGSVYAGMLVGQALADLQEVFVEDIFTPNQLSDNTVSGEVSVTGTLNHYVGGLVGKAHNVKVNQNRVSDVSINITDGINVYVGGLIGLQFLYDFDTLDSSLDLDKGLVNQNFIAADIAVNGAKKLVSGSLIGYNQNTVVENNATDVLFDFVADAVIFGGLIGENWVEDIGANITKISRYTAESTTETIGDVIGINQSADSSALGFYLNQSSLELIADDGIEVSAMDLIDDEFYSEHFSELTSEFIGELKAFYQE